MFLISLASGFGDVFPLLSAVNFRWSSIPIHLSFLSLPWGSKISLVGAHIFILIDVAKVQNKILPTKRFLDLVLFVKKCSNLIVCFARTTERQNTRTF